MKNLRIKILFLFVAMSLQSCEQIIDQINENNQEQNSFTPLRGKYTGTYTGELGGTLVINVGDKGTVEITRSTIDSYESYETGLVNSSFNTINKAPSGFILIGSLNSKTGTWQMNNLKGNWSVTKN